MPKLFFAGIIHRVRTTIHRTIRLPLRNRRDGGRGRWDESQTPRPWRPARGLLQPLRLQDGGMREGVHRPLLSSRLFPASLGCRPVGFLVGGAEEGKTNSGGTLSPNVRDNLSIFFLAVTHPGAPWGYHHAAVVVGGEQSREGRGGVWGRSEHPSEVVELFGAWGGCFFIVGRGGGREEEGKLGSGGGSWELEEGWV